MHFENPAGFWYALLVVVPLLARRRRPPVTRAVGNLYIWQEVVRQHRQTIGPSRRRHDWTLWLQVACIMAFVAASTHPVLELRTRRVALVFDASLSMAARDGATTRFDEARRRARSIISGLDAGVRVRVVAAGFRPRDMGEYAVGDPTLLRTIAHLKPTAGPARLAPAIDVALAAVTRVVVFSDFAPDDVEGIRRLPAAVRWEQVGRAEDNLAVTRVVARRAAFDDTTGDILVEARNYGVHDRDADIELFVDGRVVWRDRLHLPAREGQTIVRELSSIGKVVRAELLVQDALDADNTRLAVVPDVERVRVALLGRRRSFVETAVKVNPWVSLASREADAQVIVCDACAAAPATDRGVLMIAPQGTVGERGLVTIAQPQHPVAAMLDLGEQVAFAATGGEVDPRDVVLRAGGAPAIVAREEERRRVVEMRLDPTAADFPLTTSFPIMIANAIEWLSTHDDAFNVVSGEALRWTLRDPNGRVAVMGPDGRGRDARVSGRRVTITDTDVAGAYRVTSGGLEQLFAVNVAADSESDLAAHHLAPAPVSFRSHDALLAPTRTSLLPMILLAAFGLISAEWWLRARTI
jgi:hypothetical protein